MNYNVLVYSSGVLKCVINCTKFKVILLSIIDSLTALIFITSSKCCELLSLSSAWIRMFAETVVLSSLQLRKPSNLACPDANELHFFSPVQTPWSSWKPKAPWLIRIIKQAFQGGSGNLCIIEAIWVSASTFVKHSHLKLTWVNRKPFLCVQM